MSDEERLANILRSLVQHPEQYEMLRSNPAGLKDALGLSDQQVAHIQAAGQATAGETIEAGTVTA